MSRLRNHDGAQLVVRLSTVSLVGFLTQNTMQNAQDSCVEERILYCQL